MWLHVVQMVTLIQKRFDVDTESAELWRVKIVYQLSILIHLNTRNIYDWQKLDYLFLVNPYSQTSSEICLILL